MDSTYNHKKLLTKWETFLLNKLICYRITRTQNQKCFKIDFSFFLYQFTELQQLRLPHKRAQAKVHVKYHHHYCVRELCRQSLCREYQFYTLNWIHHDWLSVSSLSPQIDFIWTPFLYLFRYTESTTDSHLIISQLLFLSALYMCQLYCI